MLPKDALKHFGDLPCVVVGDFGADVVGNMGLADAVENVGTDGTSKVAINGAEGATLEVPLALAVVREHGIGVLEESDENEVVVDNEVRDQIIASHLGETSLEGPVGEHRCSDGNTNIGSDNLPEVSLVENGGGGLEVIGMSPVFLTGSIADEVHWPA